VLVPGEFTVRLEMASDWHVGSGWGRPGDIDRLVARDAEGLPFVPAKTLTGVWRDACELVASAFDTGHPERPWSAWVDALFGSQPALARIPIAHPPRPAALSVRSAHLPGSLRAALAGAAAPLRDALSFVKPGIRLDERTGTVLADNFRFDELARGGAVLTASCALELDGGDDARAAASALLVAGSRMVERLGGGRRRGSGRCRLVVVNDAAVAEVMAWLRATREGVPAIPPQPRTQPSGPSTRPALAQATAGGAGGDGDGGWVELPLTLRVDTPLAIPHRVTGNVAETLDHLPGTHLLPRVAGVLGRLGVDVTAALGRGDLRVLSATLEVDGERGRPAPMAVYVSKGMVPFSAAGAVVNRLCEPEENDPGPRKQVRTGYVGATANGHLPSYATVPTVMRTHNTVLDAEQRPTEEVGGVYTYEAVKPGCRLRSALLLRAGLQEELQRLAPDWWMGLGGAARLGRSKKDDFGLVHVEVGQPRLRRPDPPPSRPDGRLVIWLLSDLLLRDGRLRPDTTMEGLAAALGESLGVTLRPVDGGVFLRAGRLDSWQVRWGRPRPSLVAIAAGSCAEFEIAGEDTLDPGKSAALALEGLGERQAEGYGQLCLNDPLLLGPLGSRPAAGRDDAGAPAGRPAVPVGPPRVLAGDPAFGYARVVERAAWRALIRTRALARGADPAFRKATLRFSTELGVPPTSQLGALRAATRDLRGPGAGSWATRWLEGLRQVGSRRDKWGQALGPVGLLLDQPATVWEWLGGADWPCLTESGEEALRAELWGEAVRALLDVAGRAHQRALEAAASGVQPDAVGSDVVEEVR
jgi:CRISPR-associated protein Csx10